MKGHSRPSGNIGKRQSCAKSQGTQPGSGNMPVTAMPRAGDVDAAFQASLPGRPRGGVDPASQLALGDPPKAASQCFFKPVFLLLVLISLAACSESKKAGIESQSPLQEIRGLSMFEMSRGSYTWNLKASYAEISEHEDKILLSMPEIEFYTQGKPVSAIRGRRGELITQARDMNLHDDVVARSLEDGTVLKSRSLHFTFSSNKIWSTDDVVLYQGKTVVKGKGFSANPDMSEIIIENQETVFGDRD